MTMGSRTRRAAAAALGAVAMLAAAAGARGSDAAPGARAADMARAEEIVQGQCAVCHGPDGESSTPAFPRLAGQNATYVARQLAAFKSGARRSPTMQPMVTELSEADFAALGAWYASRPTHVHPVEDPAVAFAGRALWTGGNVPAGVPACVACHGADGHGGEAIPRLAGQHAMYVVRQLRQFGTREKTAENASMHLIAGRLSEAEMRAVASFISGMK
jgi:cytochrome c553